MNLMNEAAALAGQLTTWRRTLHAYPETGIHLPKTMAYIAGELEKLNISYKLHEDISCIEATVGSGEKCFLLRADVDGLPMQEETDLPFRAENGCMHSCGHDLHGAMLLGAAKLLKDHEGELPGTVKLLFQSGEEVFLGAKSAIEAGVLENPKVDAAFAMHVIAMMPLGVVMTGKQPMASVDGFRITLTGHGGHGSMPEAAIDPINAAVQVYLALQSLIAREIGGTEEAVLTVGRFTAGDAPNIIPQRAELQGTLRTFDPKVRQRLRQRMEEISVAVAAAYRCKGEYESLFACASVVTEDDLTGQIERTVRKLLPQFHVLGGAHGMGSEDFAEITQQVPSAYFMLGAGPDDEAQRLGQHNPKILFHEDVLPLGAAIYAQAALDWLGAQK